MWEKKHRTSSRAPGIRIKKPTDSEKRKRVGPKENEEKKQSANKARPLHLQPIPIFWKLELGQTPVRLK
jgi:hypothetical protein